MITVWWYLVCFFFSAEHDIFGEVSSSDDEVNILDGVQQAAGPSGFCADDVKDSVDLGFAEAAATLDSDVCESLKHSHWCDFENVVVFSTGLMPTEARGNYLPEAPYLRETKCQRPI